ncbi:hypothetical protein CN198_13990 [Sinorhizobium meliloti]|uniref:hypothetical protein n=1 Tax=Rhizobium meliloti TaxID=382 RepID=UPI000FD7180B|nr:hypothetical protein [Sinorhizobium meliloti]RVH69173.1 hypothetical protein CN198_13990 [Sinorhizobium meliloti]
MTDIFATLLSALATAVGATLAAWLFARVRSGRLARTLDYAPRILDFVGQCSGRLEGLEKIHEASRNDLEKLVLAAVHAVQEDFKIERDLLPEFEKTTGSFRNAFLLSYPRYRILWLPYIVFYTLVIFVIYVIALRVFQRQWSSYDTVLLLAAGLLIILVRLGVGLLTARRIDASPT